MGMRQSATIPFGPGSSAVADSDRATSGRLEAETARLRAAYLDLMRESLIGRLNEDPPLPASKVEGFKHDHREHGWDWPSKAPSMIGAKRMNNVRSECERVLKAGIYFAHCQYDNAEATVDEFEREFEPIKRELDGYLAQYQDNAQFFDFLKKVRSGEANLPPRIRGIVESALGDRTLLRNIEYVRVLDDEERRLGQAPPEFKNASLGARILQDVSVARSLAVDAAGDLARGRYNRLMEELQDLLNQSTSIKIEILNARRGVLTQEMQQGQITSGPQRVEARIRADDEHVLWPFLGEWWRDELGSYRQAISSQCGR